MKACKIEQKEKSLLQRETQRQQLLEKLRNPRGKASVFRSRHSETIEADKLLSDESKNETVNLLERMHKACESDYAAIEQGKTAMKRFLMLDELKSTLRKKHMQKWFLHLGGLRFLEQWLNQNPDGSFPAIQVT